LRMSRPEISIRVPVTVSRFPVGTRIGELLFELNEHSHTTLVLVTHDRTLASRCARIITMEAGRVV